MGIGGLILTLVVFVMFLIALVPAWYSAYYVKEH